jgi:hypothetical protein
VNEQINQRFGPLAPIMRCVARHESGYHVNPRQALTAVSPTHDHGLMQIHVYGGSRVIYGRRYTINELHTLRGNLEAAWRLLTRNGNGATDLHHWSAQRQRCFPWT